MLKDIHIWLPSYIRSALRPRRKGRRGAPVSVLFALVDHFEPWQREGDSPGLMKERVETWIEGYETTYAGHRDFAGRPPVHTYFYPQEQYRPEVISLLAEHCARGFGEVEIHIHHDGDTPSGFVEKIETFKRQLRSHGLLPTDRETG
ncbi:MAG TPA: hypothetical protein VLA34_02840, partial [Candidatus Krumholzibacterium sp.]|nr:hypothetical protein [Candidatus Krumholzibacterium sp.]